MSESTRSRKPTLQDTSLGSLYRRIGDRTRYAGIVFVCVSILFLLVAYIRPNQVLEVDSVVAFLIAMVLLLRDTKSRVQSRVLDALLVSTDQSIAQLSAKSGEGFAYVPTGKGIEGVDIVPAQTVVPTEESLKNSSSTKITPPGRMLASVFIREVGLKQLSLASLSSALGPFMSDNAGLAKSVDIVVSEPVFKFKMTGAATRCSAAGLSHDGQIGCPVASFLAVLLAAAIESPVILNGCEFESESETWTITMHALKS